MPRRCTVCDHPERAQIDRALVTDQAGYRSIAGRFQLSPPSLYRHACEHLPERLAKAKEAKEAAEADSLLGEARTLQKATLHILGTAMRSGDHRTALSAVREARGNLELLGKLLGELQSGATVTVNILASSQWRTLQAVILEALSDYPDARTRVATALLTVERAN